MSHKPIIPDMRILRIAILGCGWMAGQHAKALASQPDVEVVAVCGRSLAKAEAFIIALGLSRAQPYADLTTMLDAVAPDALYVVLPPDAHRGQTELAAARGVHVFLEKPIALDAEQARAQAAAVSRAGVISQVGFHMRHGAAVRRLHAMISDGSAGRPTLFQGSYHCNALHADWWRDRSRSGGQVLEQAIHLYDLAIHLLGDPVAAWGQLGNLCHQDAEGYTVEDTSIGMLRHANGAMTTIAGSNCAVPGAWTAHCTVVCGRVTAVFTDANHAEFALIQADGTVRHETISDQADLYAAEAADFLDAIRNGRPACAPVGHGVRSLEAVLAMTGSAAGGGTPTLLPTPRS
jgi:predicted dehydrogenase